MSDKRFVMALVVLCMIYNLAWCVTMIAGSVYLVVAYHWSPWWILAGFALLCVGGCDMSSKD